MWKTPEKCGKVPKKCGKHVENMWITAPKMWKSAPKMWETLWIKCGNVENMWETHLYVQMCKIVGNYTNESQFFLFFYFFIFLFFYFFIFFHAQVRAQVRM